MFTIKITGNNFTKTLQLTEEELSKYVPSFVVYSAKMDGSYDTTVVNEGESYFWNITYVKPN